MKAHNEKNAEKVKVMKDSYESIYDEKAAKAAAYFQENREQIRAQRKAFWTANPELKSTYDKDRREKIKAQRALRRSKELMKTPTFDNEEWGDMMAKELMKIQFTEEDDSS